MCAIHSNVVVAFWDGEIAETFQSITNIMIAVRRLISTQTLRDPGWLHNLM